MDFGAAFYKFEKQHLRDLGAPRRMPKRGRVSKRFNSKRGRFMKRKPGNRFINQLGGWSTYPNRRSRPVTRYYNSLPVQVDYAGGARVHRDTLKVDMADIPGSLRAVYQRMRIKKITAFVTPEFRAPSGNNSMYQVAICRSLQKDGNIVPTNVPGAQIKMFSGSADNGSVPTKKEIEIVQYISGGQQRPPDFIGGLGLIDQNLYMYDGTFSFNGSFWQPNRFDALLEGIPLIRDVPVTQPSDDLCSGITDVITASRFYPPVSIAVYDSAGAAQPVGKSPDTKENWLDTDDTDGAWDCFNLQFTLANGDFAISSWTYYLEIVLLCDGQKA